MRLTLGCGWRNRRRRRRLSNGQFGFVALGGVHSVRTGGLVGKRGGVFDVFVIGAIDDGSFFHRTDFERTAAHVISHDDTAPVIHPHQAATAAEGGAGCVLSAPTHPPGRVAEVVPGRTRADGGVSPIVAGEEELMALSQFWRGWTG